MMMVPFLLYIRLFAHFMIDLGAFVTGNTSTC